MTRIKHTPGTYLLIAPSGETIERVTYDRSAGAEAKREAWQFALERQSVLTARDEAARVAEANLAVALAVAAERGVWEPAAEELAEVRAWLDEAEAVAELATFASCTTTTTPPQAAPITPTPGQLDAALTRREHEAERAIAYAKAGGDAKGAKIARRSAQAYRDARAIAADGGYRATANGDLLVKSRSRNQWHVVARQPANGDGWSPITCTCEWMSKAHALGPCAHVGFFEGYQDAAEEAVAERDEEAGPLVLAA